MKNIVNTDQIAFTVSKDKILTYALVVLIIATVLVGYSIVSNKNQVKADNKQTNQSCLKLRCKISAVL